MSYGEIMTRDTFLALVGDPFHTETECLALREEAQALWQTIRDQFFTKAGKERKATPSGEAVSARRSVDTLRARAAEMGALAYDQRRAHEDPWSHTRPDVLEYWRIRRAQK